MRSKRGIGSPLQKFGYPFCKISVYFDNSKPRSLKEPRREFPFLNSLVQDMETGREQQSEGKELNFEFSHTLHTMSSCKKVAYLNTDPKLNAFLAYAEMTSGKQYRKGKERLLPCWEGFTYGIRNKSWYLGMQKLMTSGIYNIWEKWYALQYPNEEQEIMKNYSKGIGKMERVKRLAMKSNIWSIFLIYFMLITFSCTILTAEASIKYKTTYAKIILFYFKMRLKLIDFINSCTQWRAWTRYVLRKYFTRIKQAVILSNGNSIELLMRAHMGK